VTDDAKSHMKQEITVMKFGGTSVADAECIKRAGAIIQGAVLKGPVVVIVSAMSGVTNALIQAAHQARDGHDAASSELARLLTEQHVSAIKTLLRDEDTRASLTTETECIIQQAWSICHGTALLRELTPRALDAVCSVGERLSAKLFAAMLCEMGVPSRAIDAIEIIVTDATHGQAEPDLNQTQIQARCRVLPLLEEGLCPVITGFIGATPQGTLTTLGRGGSDYSATIIGAVLDAQEIVIWTDVDGVLSADPRLVKEARTLREISYNEAAELAYFGAKVLHPKTLRPVAEAGIPVWIRNTFAPSKAGTRITAQGSAKPGGVKAITAIDEVSIVTVGGRGIVGVPEVVARAFAATAKEHVTVLLITQASSQNDICFVVHSTDTERTVQALRETFSHDLAQRKVEHITVDREVAVVAAVGERMRGTVGVAGRTFSALARAQINVIAIAQGSSEYNISFVVEAQALKRAVEAVHQEFELEKEDPMRRAEEPQAVDIPSL